jgi:hypothetical protein
LFGLVKEKKIMEIVNIKQIKANEKRSAHNRGCICGIKRYPGG